ncbi:MAG: septum formation initiator family protein [Spirochaetaceae bacterium]
MKLWIPLVTGLATYLLLTLLFGEYGVFNYEELRRYRSRLDSHVGMLEVRRGELETERELLLENEERIRIEARSLGYLDTGERLLRIDGADKPDREAWVAGSVTRSGQELPDHSGAIRTISICSALLAFILLHWREPSETRRRRRRVAEQAREDQEEAYSIRRASM